MKEKNTDEQWLSRMAERLRSHEEPYQEGAWERFASRLPDGPSPVPVEPTPTSVRRLSPVFFRIAAAVLLLAAVVYFWPVAQEGESLELVSSSSTAPDLLADPAMPYWGEEGTQALESVAAQPAPVQQSAFVQQQESPAQQLAPASQLAFTPQLTQVGAAGLEEPALISLDTDRLGQSVEEDRFARFLASEAQQEVQVLSRESERDFSSDAGTDPQRVWGMGVVLSPNLTSEQVNFGGGLHIAYQLTDRLSIRTGVALGQYGVNSDGPRVLPPELFGVKPKGIAADEGSMGAPLSPHHHASMNGQANIVAPNYHTRFLDRQTSSLLGLDIPIDLTYAINDRFYTSVGVSYFSVLNERRTNHYIDRLNEPVQMNSNSSGAMESFEIKTLYVEGPASQQPLEGRGYTGFLNLSMGHRSQLTRKLRLSIEPFVKLPVGRLAGEDMNMTHGGIRIVTGF